MLNKLGVAMRVVSSRTVHKVGQVDLVGSLIGVVIGQKTCVIKLPAKGIWNDDNDAFELSAVCRLSHVRVQSMKRSGFASGSPFVNATLEAGGAGHFGRCWEIETRKMQECWSIERGDEGNDDSTASGSGPF